MTDSLLPCEIVQSDNPSKAIIWLHGLGASGHDFVPMAHALRMPEVRFVFPHAPERHVTINNARMRAWFDIKSLQALEPEDTQGMDESRELIRNLIENELQQGFTLDQIALGGFSQGGVMTLFTGLSYEKPLASLMALSCYLPQSGRFDEWRVPANQNTPIFLAHGQFDPVLPFQLAQHGHHLLQNAEYKVAWHAYPMGHQVCDEEIAHLRNYIETTTSESV